MSSAARRRPTRIERLPDVSVAGHAGPPGVAGAVGPAITNRSSVAGAVGPAVGSVPTNAASGVDAAGTGRDGAACVMDSSGWTDAGDADMGRAPRVHFGGHQQHS